VSVLFSSGFKQGHVHLTLQVQSTLYKIAEYVPDKQPLRVLVLSPHRKTGL